MKPFHPHTVIAFVLALLGSVAAVAQSASSPLGTFSPIGHWQFQSDKTGITITASDNSSDGLSARLVQLPSSAQPLSSQDQQKLCGLAMIGALKPTIKKLPNDKPKYEGWIIDPEDIFKTATPSVTPCP